jgi:hypothetical protein
MSDELAPFLRDYTAEIDDVSDGARKWVVARINTDAVDSYNTVVDPAGMERGEYIKNPVVLWEHGKDAARGRVPIGRNSWIKARPEKRDVLAKTVFADDEFSRGLFELYRDGYIRGWSVNGVPTRAGKPTKEEIARRPDLERCSLIYRGWTLKEYSGVAIPGNLDAITEACSRGVWVPDAVRSLLPPAPDPAPEPDAEPNPEPPAIPELPPLVGRSLAECLDSIERRSRDLARAELRQAMQDARDLARGKV